jgi:heme/copper-type cytochrome/quinol oxidase subunit 4/mono/diheme cytochrome c family protein
VSGPGSATKDHSHGSVGNYILVALILGVITYIEFAIVEYPQAWLGQTWTLVVLAVLSVVKFVMVVMFFMHLKGDDRLYSGFFSSGMLIAVLSFLAMMAMFVLPRSMSYADAPMVRAEAAGEASGAAAHGSEAGHGAAVDTETLDLIATDGRSRTAADMADSPSPADRSLAVEAPQAANDASTYEVSPPTPLAADADAAAGDSQVAAEDAAEAAAAAEEAAAAAEEAAADEAAAEEAAAEEAAADEAAADEAAAEEAAAAGQAAGDAPAEEPAAQSADAGAWDQAQGLQVFTANCSACHQATGVGIPGAFPPLADHLGEIHEAGGREQLIRTILFGLQGQIQVNGMTYNGFMPGWPQLDDAAIANTLNHVIIDLGAGAPAGFTPYTAAEVAAHRGEGLTPAAVHELRGELALD